MIKSLQPSGKWGTQDAYAFVWQTVLREFSPDVIAVARPHSFARVGDRVVLDARSDTTLLVLNGAPIDEPVAMHGPFVMNSKSEITQAIEDYHNGRLGRLAA